MTDLHTWATRWHVPPEALSELGAVLTAADPDAEGDGSEAGAMSRVALQASRQGIWLLRNNSGVLPNPRGRPVRFGLGNVSKQVNQVMKSSDWIGIEPVLVTPEMVGQVIGRLFAAEVKPDGWTYTGTGREMAQKAFGMKVISMGGRFVFSTGRGPL